MPRARAAEPASGPLARRATVDRRASRSPRRWPPNARRWNATAWCSRVGPGPPPTISSERSEVAGPSHRSAAPPTARWRVCSRAAFRRPRPNSRSAPSGRVEKRTGRCAAKGWSSMPSDTSRPPKAGFRMSPTPGFGPTVPRSARSRPSTGAGPIDLSPRGPRTPSTTPTRGHSGTRMALRTRSTAGTSIGSQLGRSRSAARSADRVSAGRTHAISGLRPRRRPANPRFTIGVTERPKAGSARTAPRAPVLPRKGRTASASLGRSHEPRDTGLDPRAALRSRLSAEQIEPCLRGSARVTSRWIPNEGSGGAAASPLGAEPPGRRSASRSPGFEAGRSSGGATWPRFTAARTAT